MMRVQPEGKGQCAAGIVDQAGAVHAELDLDGVDDVAMCPSQALYRLTASCWGKATRYPCAEAPPVSRHLMLVSEIRCVPSATSGACFPTCRWVFFR
jgi:hypothetical protein